LRNSLAPKRSSQLVLSYHVDPAQARSIVQRLSRGTNATLAQSVTFWDEYFASCPVQPYNALLPFADRSREVAQVNPQQFVIRQLWHWWVVLTNVTEIEFNRYSPFMAPDRNRWFGTWSNDGPEALCALAMTNQWALAGRCLREYVRTSINAVGNLSWYTHSDGIACLGAPGDSGYYSHGVPAVVHAVEFYVRITGDATLLDASINDRWTVWDKLVQYMQHLWKVRDINHDGLLEWVNLWETGWDDKPGPFFSRSALTEWITVIERNDPTEIADWYGNRSVPVTAMSEQVQSLWALRSFSRLADLKGDPHLVTWSAQQASSVVARVESRHWDGHGYVDWDVKHNVQSSTHTLDGFYFLYFTQRADRVHSMVRQLTTPRTFGLPWPPVVSADDPHFDPQGYWTGSHWPREMLYLALGLNHQHEKGLALTVLLKGIMAADGCIIPERLNPTTGTKICHVDAMAYSGALNLGLLEVLHNDVW